MSTPDAPALTGLRALLEAASPSPWNIGISTDVEYGPWPVMRIAEMRDPTDQREVQANRRLAALAPTLAQLVLDMGEALGKMEQEYSGNDETIRRDLMLKDARDIIARLADLNATLPPVGEIRT